jgi:hypothetical protein
MYRRERFINKKVGGAVFFERLRAPENLQSSVDTVVDKLRSNLGSEERHSYVQSLINSEINTVNGILSFALLDWLFEIVVNASKEVFRPLTVYEKLMRQLEPTLRILGIGFAYAVSPSLHSNMYIVLRNLQQSSWVSSRSSSCTEDQDSYKFKMTIDLAVTALEQKITLFIDEVDSALLETETFKKAAANASRRPGF